jgi:hypothetical protein
LPAITQAKPVKISNSFNTAVLSAHRRHQLSAETAAAAVLLHAVPAQQRVPAWQRNRNNAAVLATNTSTMMTTITSWRRAAWSLITLRKLPDLGSSILVDYCLLVPPCSTTAEEAAAAAAGCEHMCLLVCKQDGHLGKEARQVSVLPQRLFVAGKHWH